MGQMKKWWEKFIKSIETIQALKFLDKIDKAKKSLGQNLIDAIF